MLKFLKDLIRKNKEMSKNIDIEREKYSFLPEIIFISFLLFFIILFYFTTDINLFGNKKTSFFDYWGLVHVFSGGTLSYLAFKLRDFHIKNPILFIMYISLSWEILESYIEQGIIFESISPWFGGQENFFNRFFGDQLAILLGFVLIKFKPNLYYVFLILSISFLVFHIFIGDSTYLI